MPDDLPLAAGVAGCGDQVVHAFSALVAAALADPSGRPLRSGYIT